MTTSAWSGPLALATWALLVPWLLRAWPQVRPTAAVAGGLAVAGLVAVAALDPAGLPFAMLVEGTESYVHAYLWVAHGWLAPLDVPGPGDPMPIRLAVRLHLAETVLSLALLATTLRALLPPLPALAVLAGVAASPWLVQPILAPAPTPTLLLMGLLATQAAAARHAPEAWVRWVAAVAVGLAALTAGTLRIETAAVGLAATTAVLAHAVEPGRADTLDRWVRRLPPGVAALAAVIASSGVVWAVATLLAGPLGATAVWASAAPWRAAHWGNLRLPLDLLAFLPAGVAALAVAGLAVAPGRGLAWVAVTAGLLGSTRLLADASHRGGAPLETLRYLAPYLGVFALLAAIALQQACARWPRAAPALAAAVLVTLPWRPLAPPPVDGAPWALVRTTQVEGAAFLADVVERWPDCLLATRLLEREGQRPLRWRTAWFGGATGRPKVARTEDLLGGPPATPDDPAELHAPPADRYPCVLFVTGLDCNVPGADCEAWTEGLPRELSRELRAPEHNTHHPHHRSPLRLEVHRVR